MVSDDRQSALWLGRVEVDPCRPIVAGEYGTWRIRYTVGRYGVDNGGRIKLLWKTVSDWGVPQWKDPAGPNYVTVSSSADVRFDLSYDPKGYYRPWLSALTIRVYDGYLAEGDEVTVVLGDRSGGSPGSRAQTFCQKDFYFRLVVDCFETSEFKEVPDQPIIPVISGPARRLVLIAPSQVAPGESCSLILKAEDKWGNVAEGYRGTVRLESSGQVEGLPQEVTFSPQDRGRIRIQGVSFPRPGLYFLRAWDQESGFRAQSNPIECAERGAERLYWGDLHGQTKSTLGMGTDAEYFDYARNVGGVQVSSIQGNDFHLLGESWTQLKETVREYYAPGEFVTFLGYEWSGNTSAGGDHCVYYLDEDIPIHRSSHWQIEDKSDQHQDRYPVRELYDELRGKRAFLIPHIGGRRAILDYLTPEDQELVPVIEIASVHGRFEWFLHEALEKGLVVGVVGASDDHTCRPGAAYPTDVELRCRGGLTGIYARELTREGIWEALKARRCYATTGERIILKVSSNGNPMGSVMTTSSPPSIEVEVIGTAPLEKVEIVRDTTTIYRHSLVDEDDFIPGAFRILWGGARLKTRGRLTVWDGTLSIQGGRFVEVREVAFEDPAQGVKYWDQWRIEWQSTTSGDVDGLVVRVDGPEDAVVTFSSPPVTFSFSLAELAKGNIHKDVGGVQQRVEVSRVPRGRGPLRTRFSFTDKGAPQGRHAYYVRVTQEDQEMAWSSPIYITVR